MKATLWVVAGAPGAGKSTLASLLLRSLTPAPAFLDKDTMYSSFVDATLTAAQRPLAEREGDWYDKQIKVHEYAGLTATAREIRSHGCPVLLCAPFTGQIRSPERWSSWAAELGGGDIRLVWVRCDELTLRTRLEARASERDGQKLRDWNTFVSRILPDTPPPVAHIGIDNRDGAPTLEQQVALLLHSSADHR